ncbi:MAG: hypothetical protein KVP17_004654 [Porospora cf. gigantea B]|uniref:uncharacterized protein n=1 Tax=Porospora cf. gigantea B TaxID=2853592 RepID=UPI0035717DD6|nr:MAG: hypothetical protein KVP17_004654 [Porospora cf. gigantea B]
MTIVHLVTERFPQAITLKQQVDANGSGRLMVHSSLEQCLKYILKTRLVSYIVCHVKTISTTHKFPSLNRVKAVQGFLMFYAHEEHPATREASAHPKVVFMTGSVKEMRRGVCWLQSGYDFSQTLGACERRLDLKLDRLTRLMTNYRVQVSQ